MNRVYIALGSNRGDREKNLRDAIKLIEEKAGKVLSVSSVYETEPWQMNDSVSFLNQVILMETKQDGATLMEMLIQIEKSMGRIRHHGVGYESRTIDLDILFFNNEVIQSESLVVPHPQIAKRRFVLEPLAEIAPDYVHPVLKKTMLHLLKSCADKHSVRKFVSK
jgi:2-amino-4-hydroxy-6-hydroxymethyldihydropteridine diphosphokinase